MEAEQFKWRERLLPKEVEQSLFLLRGEYSSVGRALPLQGRGQGFESLYFHPSSFLCIFIPLPRCFAPLRSAPFCGGGAVQRWRQKVRRWGSLSLNEEVINQIFFLGQRTEGLRWRPRHSETMKGAEAGDTLRGAGNKHRSEDSRIGQPQRTPF